MPEVLLINPNSNRQTTVDMAGALRRAFGDLGAMVSIRTATAVRAPRMIVDEQALSAAATEVVPLALEALRGADAVVVAAFGDPGVDVLRAQLQIPVLGIGGAAIAEGALAGRRFGIATTTPGLARSIDARVQLLGHQDQYSGLRLTDGDPTALHGDRLYQELLKACELCIEQDGAEAVVIGGGPLGGAADRLRDTFDVPVINAAAAAGRQALELIGGEGSW